MKKLQSAIGILALVIGGALITGSQADAAGAACGGRVSGASTYSDAVETYGGSNCKVQAVLKRAKPGGVCCYYYYGRWGNGSSHAYGSGGYAYDSTRNNCIRFEHKGKILSGMSCN